MCGAMVIQLCSFEWDLELFILVMQKDCLIKQSMDFIVYSDPSQ